MKANQPSTNGKGGGGPGSGEGSGPGSGGMLGARIMGLKFMQRRAQQQQQQQQPGDAVPQPAADTNGAAVLAQTTAARSEFEWSVPPVAAAVRAAAPVRVLHETEAEQPNSREVLLHFRAGRRSRRTPPPHTSHPRGTNAARLQSRQSCPRHPVHPLSTIISAAAPVEGGRLGNQWAAAVPPPSDRGAPTTPTGAGAVRARPSGQPRPLSRAATRGGPIQSDR